MLKTQICVTRPQCVKTVKWYRSQKETAYRLGWEGTERRGGGPGGQEWRSAVVGAERENKSSATNELPRIKHSALQSPDLTENTVIPLDKTSR